ncbi:MULTISPECIES: DUF6453 family protein [Kosakonia]|uniref:DUF6453 family protein n=1 Tax=Kosakonia TaxID=1330547 RepID=UPI000A558057|nr:MULTISPECIES: DUF6453 family protein [Kosakonia]RCX01877.1 hypothetical protein DFO56_104603 [Kosakonia sp. AG348]
MPSGLYINYNDGRPAMEITANLRCPSFCRNVGSAGSTTEVISEYIPGSQLIYIPSRAAAYSPPSGTAIIGTVSYLRNVTFNGALMTHDSVDNNGIWAGQVWQLLPVNSPSGNRGLLIANSTDFSVISDVTRIMTCIWHGNITINGQAAAPTSGVLFAKWNHPTASITLENGVLYARESRTDSSDVNANVTIYAAIFNVSSPTPGVGLNIINSSGQCTFSTARKPLIYSGSFSPTSNWQDIGSNMVPLGTYGYEASNGGGWCNMRLRGLMMSGNSVKTGNSKITWQWTDRYSIVGSRNVGISIPLIPDIY